MGWKEDLEELLAGVGRGSPIGQENLPFDELARGDWGGAATAPLSAGFNFLDLPLSTVKEGIGQGINVVQGEGLGGWGTGRKEWEGSIEEVPMPIKVALELGLDPTTYMGLGVVKRGANALRGAAELRGAGAGSDFLTAAADIGDVATFAFDKAPWEVTKRVVSNPVTRPVGRAAKSGIERIMPNAFELSPQARVTRKAADYLGSFDELLTSRGKSFKGMVPALVPGGTKSLAAIDDYDVPPFFAKDLDDGVPNRVKQLAWESWQNLKMSRPDIPGINAPGMSPARPGEATFMEGQRPRGGIRDVASKYLSRITDPSVGFIKPPAGGYRDPSDVRIDEENLTHMARIGAAVMLDFDNDTSNKLFQPLRRANEGMQQVVDRLVGEYGPGIRPYLTGSYDEMNENLLRFQRENNLPETPLPGSRFMTPWGFPEERTGTARIDKLEGRVGSKSVPDATAAYDIAAGRGFSKGHPELVESGAGIGGGFLASVRPADASDSAYRAMFDPSSGSLRPTDIDPATGRAVIPAGFESQWETNRQAYDHFMIQLFPGLERRPQELDTLRRMSVEVLYDEMVNAAGEVSGGLHGATAFLKKTPDRMRGDSHRKIGAYADPDDPSQIGNRADDLDDDLPPGMYGNPSLRSRNEREVQKLIQQRDGLDELPPPPTNKTYREVTGKPLGRSLTDEDLVEMVEALGGTPWRPNRQGGPLPNIQRLIDAFKPGKDILVGDRPADEWYDAATEEALAIVGPGRYEDAMMLLELMAITSSGTEVTLNAQRALRAFAEWKLGSDETIREALGLAPDDVDRLLKKGGTWEGLRGAFRGGISSSQKTLMNKTFNEYVARRSQANPSTAPVQGGPKTQNFSGSFVINLWEDAIDYALKDRNPELHQRIRKALDKAATPFAWDRHMSRSTEHATAVSPMESVSMRELGIQAAKVAQVRPEDFQAGLWYTVKDNQGFRRIERSDDMARAMREMWNAKKSPGRMAEIRQMLRDQNPDLDINDPMGVANDLIDEQAEDIMRQEVAIAIIQDELKNVSKTLKKELGTSSPIKALFGLGDDTLGIINRAGRGIAPTRRASLGIPKLAGEAAKELQRIRSGQSFGSTYGWNGSEFVPESPTSGYAVAITSAGRSLDTRKPETAARSINQFVAKYGDLLDDPSMADRIKFGTFQMDDPTQASFDLTVIVPDESAAIALAKRANQKAIYDIARGTVIETGGTGVPTITRPREVRDVIEEILGPGQLPERERLTDVIKRGATVEEMDKVNPVSILNRRIVQPIMERYEEASQAYIQANPGADATKLPGGEAILPPGGSDLSSPFDFRSIGQDPLITTQANTLLGETIDGEAVGQRMQRYYDEAEKDLSILDNKGAIWDPDSTLKERLDLANGDKELEDIIKKYDKLGIDPRFADARSVTHNRIRKDLSDAEGVDFDRSTTWDLFRAAWGEMALFSPKYHTGNIFGSWVQNALGGHFSSGSPGEYLAALKIVRGGLSDPTRKEYLNQLKSYQVFNKWGYDELPQWVTRGGVRSMTSNRTRASRSAIGELTSKVTRSERLGRTIGKPFVYNADLSQGVETVVRGTLAADVLDREMTAAMTVLEDSINTMASRQGLEDFEFSILNNINPVPGGPSAKRLKEHLMGMGFAEGYAERAGRNFAEAKNLAESVAKREVDKRQFSYERTNLDEFISKFIPFHYWYSRALRYYSEESLRHPFLILNYMRANRGIEAAQDDPGLSARQKGFLRLMGTPLGFSVLMNPDALFGVVKVFGLQDGYTPDGETEAGGVINWLKARGLGLYPWIDGALNMMGVYGDTFEPDLLGIRHKALIGASVNFVRSQAGFDPAGSPYADAMGQARYVVSSLVSQFTPEWFAQPVLPKAGGSQSDATLDNIIESRIIANNPQLTNSELLDIMSDPDSPEYNEAFQQVATSGLIQQLLNFTAPTNFRLRDDARDVRSAQVSTIYEAAEKQGVNPWEFKPSVADVQFASRYKNLTGKDWKPSDYQNALDEKNLTEATPEAKPFILAEQEFRRLGGEKNQAIFDRYNDLRNGTAASTATLPADHRQALADLWAEQNGYTERINHVYRLRESFESTHPEFAAFRNWQSQMYDLQNNLGGNLDEYRRQAMAQNPNAKKYFERIGQFIRENYPQDQWSSEFDRRTLNAEAYMEINGIPQERYDQAPVPGIPQGDPTALSMGLQQQQQSYTPPEDWVTSLRQVYPYAPRI